MSDPVTKQNHLDDPQVINQDQVRDRARTIIVGQIHAMPQVDLLSGHGVELAEMLAGADTLTSGLRIRDHYVCTGLSDARELLREAGTILAVFGSIEQAALGTRVDLLGSEEDAGAYNHKLQLFLDSPVSRRLSRTERSQVQGLFVDPAGGFHKGTRQAVPQYGDVASVLPDAPIDAGGHVELMGDLTDQDFDMFADLHQQLLDVRMGGGSTRSLRSQLSMLPPDTARTAVARALLSAAESAVQAATTYLGQVMSRDNIAAYQAMEGPAPEGDGGEGGSDGQGQKSQGGNSGGDAALLQGMAGFGLMAAQLHQSLSSGHITLSAAQQMGGSTDIASMPSGPGSQVLLRAQEDHQRQQLTILPPAGTHQNILMQPLSSGGGVGNGLPNYFRVLSGTPSEQLLTIQLPQAQPAMPNFGFATQSALAVNHMLTLTGQSGFEQTFDGLQTLHMQRQAELRQQADSRRRAQALKLGGDKPIGHGLMVAALSGLADAPGEGGRLTISLGAQASHAIATAGVEGQFSLSYDMGDTGATMLKLEFGATGKIGVKFAKIFEAGIEGGFKVAYGYRFQDHNHAARFILGCLTRVAEELATAGVPNAHQLINVEGGSRTPFQEGTQIVDVEGNIGAYGEAGDSDSNGIRLGLSTSARGREFTTPSGDVQRGLIRRTTGSLTAAASAGGVKVGVNVALAWEKVENDVNPDNNGDYFNISGGLGLTLSDASAKSPGGWRGNLLKAVTDAMEGLKAGILRMHPALARSSAFAGQAWQNMVDRLRKKVTEKVGGTQGGGMTFEFGIDANFVAAAADSDGDAEDYRMQYLRIVLTSGVQVSQKWGDDAVLEVNFSAGMSETDKLFELVGSNTLTYIKGIYKASGSAPGVPVGEWDDLRGSKQGAIFEAMWNCVWKDGQGPASDHSTGPKYMPLFRQMQSDESKRAGRVREKIDAQADDYLVLLEQCMEAEARGEGRR